MTEETVVEVPPIETPQPVDANGVLIPTPEVVAATEESASETTPAEIVEIAKEVEEWVETEIDKI